MVQVTPEAVILTRWDELPPSHLVETKEEVKEWFYWEMKMAKGRGTCMSRDGEMKKQVFSFYKTKFSANPRMPQCTGSYTLGAYCW